MQDALLLADPVLQESLDQMRRGEVSEALTAAEEAGRALGRLTEQDMAVTRRQLEGLNRPGEPC